MNHIKVKAPCDLYGRKATFICQQFNHLGMPAWIEYRGRSVPATSKLGVETLDIKRGYSFVVTCECPEQKIEKIFYDILLQEAI